MQYAYLDRKGCLAGNDPSQRLGCRTDGALPVIDHTDLPFWNFFPQLDLDDLTVPDRPHRHRLGQKCQPQFTHDQRKDLVRGCSLGIRLQFQPMFQKKLVIKLISHRLLAQADERIFLHFGQTKVLTAQGRESPAPHKNFPKSFKSHLLQGWFNLRRGSDNSKINLAIPDRANGLRRGMVVDF